MHTVVIGTGFGEHVMAPAYSKAGSTVEVISPRDRHSVERALDGPAGLVSVHSPPFMHFEHVTMALDRGLPVLCDKPFCRTVQEAEALYNRARELGVPNFVNFELRWKPARSKLKQLIADGAIGALEHVNWSMFGDGLRQQKHGWLFDAALGGGWIGAYGAHCIDALCWLTGSEIVRSGGLSRIDVTSRPGRDGGTFASTAEDAFSVWLEFGSGCTASLDSGFCKTAALPERIVLLGSQGLIEMADDSSLVLRRTGEADTTFDFNTAPDQSYASALDPWLSEVLGAVREGRQIAPGFYDGLANTRALEALREAVLHAPSASTAPILPV